MVEIMHSNILELFELREHAFASGGQKPVEVAPARETDGTGADKPASR